MYFSTKLKKSRKGCLRTNITPFFSRFSFWFRLFFVSLHLEDRYIYVNEKKGNQYRIFVL